MSYQMDPPLAPNMPTDVRETFEWCHAYHCRLRRMYRMCCQLFDSGPQTIHLLNQTAPMFFYDVWYAFNDDMQLCISRLTDPPQSIGHANLGLNRLIDLVEAHHGQNSALVYKMRTLFANAEAEVCPIREKRNKMIAHRYHITLTGGIPVFLNADKRRYEAIFEIFDEILNKVQECYGGQRIPVDFMEAGSDAKKLVDQLQKGRDAIIEVDRASRQP